MLTRIDADKDAGDHVHLRLSFVDERRMHPYDAVQHHHRGRREGKRLRQHVARVRSHRSICVLAVSWVKLATAQGGKSTATVRSLDAKYRNVPAPEEKVTLSLLPGPTRTISKPMMGDWSDCPTEID
jgi:hypothetical protein